MQLVILVFQWELGLLGIVRVLYRGYEQLVSLVGIIAVEEF